MAEKRVEESSDSEDYLSADEGLGNSRGSEGRAKVEGLVHVSLSISLSNVCRDSARRTVQHTNVLLFTS